MSNIETVRKANCLLVNLSTADNADFTRAAMLCLLDRILERVSDRRAFRLIIDIARDYDVLPARKRLAWKALPSLAAHQYGFAHGPFFEALQVGGQTPRHSAVQANHTVLGHGDHQSYNHVLQALRKFNLRRANSHRDRSLDAGVSDIALKREIREFESKKVCDLRIDLHHRQLLGRSGQLLASLIEVV